MPSKQAIDDISRMTRQPDGHLTLCQRLAASSMYAHRLLNCFFPPPHVLPRAGEEEGLSEPITSTG